MNRSFADDIRSRTDVQLRDLLLARPDLAHPAPSDLTALAARAATRSSVQLAVERIDTAHLQVLEAVVVAAGSSRRVDKGALGSLLGTDADTYLQRLWALALLWQSPEGLRLVGMVPQVLGQPDSPPGRRTREPLPEAPALQLTRPGQDAIDASAGWRARETVRLVEDLAQAWALDPPRALRAGGLSVRDLGATASRLDTTAGQAAWVVELAFAAGLLAEDGHAGSAAFLPTGDFDAWSAQPAARRWAGLARVWIDSTRAAHLVGTATGRPGKVNALGLDVSWPPIVLARFEVLDAMAALEQGTGATDASLVARALWNRPLRDPSGWEQVVRAVLREADWLGAVARGGLSSAGRALLADADEPTLAALAEAMLPAAVDHILLQADLTAVVPGPVEGELAELLRLVTNVESRGGATVLRFTPGSVRRALDGGRTADEVLEKLHTVSRTPVPQPLEYLVRDAARRHGQTRVGKATAYVRSDDEVALSGLLADRSLGAARLRRIAPTVLICAATPADLLQLLREAGYAPVQEGADGSIVIASQPRRRARPGFRLPQERRPHGLDLASASALVASLRGASAARQATLPVDLHPSAIAATLRDAAGRAEPAWVGYADANGATSRSLMWVVRLDGG
ncbi:MAG: helicase-associated domain-containing protein, partial [Dermatophilaceae bacterium]